MSKSKTNPRRIIPQEKLKMLLNAELEDLLEWAKYKIRDMIADDKEDMHFIRLDFTLNYDDVEDTKFSVRTEFIPGGVNPSDNPAVFEIGNMDEELKASLDLPRDLQIELIDVLREDILCWRESLTTSLMPDELSANSQEEKLNTEARDE